MRAAEAAPVSAREADALFADLADIPALLLAVSGGPDSTALLWLAARWRKKRKRGPDLIAVTVDHGLRADAADEAKAVRRLARTLGVTHRIMPWKDAKPKTGLQQAARHARYRLLAAAAEKAGTRHVLTAHTLDDQAETVLFRLARGSGLSGLSAMGPRSDIFGVTLVRPFLGLPKARLIATLRAAKIDFAEDPSNRDPRFTRARLRELMPVLAPEGLSAERLAVLARRLRRADVAIEAMVQAAARRLALPDTAGRAIAFDAAAFARLPAEVAMRLLGRAIAESGNEGAVELGKLEALCEAIFRSDPGRTIRRTLAGAMVTFGPGGLVVQPAPARRNRAQGRISP